MRKTKNLWYDDSNGQSKGLSVSCLFYYVGLHGLYFMLNGMTYPPGDFVLISDIGPQPAYRNDSGSTLICVTTNVNTACCRSNDNNALSNATAGSVGEWYYPNGTIVPRPGSNVTDFERVRYTHQVRLGRAVSNSVPPLGGYTCRVPEPSGAIHRASIIIRMGMYK